MSQEEIKKMENREFRIYYNTLNKLGDEISENVISLMDLSPLGLIHFSRRVRKDLEAFEQEVIARAKNKFQNNKSEEEHFIENIGKEVYDNTLPEYVYGLDFGKEKK